MPSSTSSPYEATPLRAGSTPGLERAVASLTRSRVVLWAIVVLQGISLLRSFKLTHMGWQGWTTLAAMVVSVLMLLAYGDALAQFRAIQNQRNLERLSKSHALIWATLAAVTVLQLL
jgi:hypothetical protein